MHISMFANEIKLVKVMWLEGGTYRKNVHKNGENGANENPSYNAGSNF